MFREDTITAKTRKPHKCTWCCQNIEIGSQMIRVRGATDNEGYWTGKFHPECRRAEYFYWKENEQEDGWPCHQLPRGRNDDELSMPPEFIDRPFTAHELNNGREYSHEWRVEMVNAKEGL